MERAEPSDAVVEGRLGAAICVHLFLSGCAGYACDKQRGALSRGVEGK